MIILMPRAPALCSLSIIQTIRVNLNVYVSQKLQKLEMKKDSLETRQKDYITAFSSDKKFIKTLSIADEEALRADVQQKSSQVCSNFVGVTL